jgi:hypothetical protein
MALVHGGVSMASLLHGAHAWPSSSPQPIRCGGWCVGGGVWEVGGLALAEASPPLLGRVACMHVVVVILLAS